MMNNYRTRCKDCFLLIEGDNGEWKCDEAGRCVEDVQYCPEGVLPSLVEDFDCLACESLEWDAGYLYCSVDGGLVDELDECPEEPERCYDCDNEIENCECCCEECGRFEEDCLCEFCETCESHVDSCECV